MSQKLSSDLGLSILIHSRSTHGQLGLQVPVDGEISPPTLD